MIIGTLKINCHLHGVHSLKEKRTIIKSIVERLRSRFNTSASEVQANDNKRLAVIALAIVSNDSRFINKQLDTIIEFIRADGRFSLGDIEIQVFPI